MLKNNKGITLIVLVITIIVLLILAGVSLNMSIGNNSIIDKTQNAKLDAEDIEWNERAEAIFAGALSNKDNIEGTGDETMKTENMRQYFLKAFKKASEDKNKVFVDVNNKEYVIVDNQRIYILNKDFSNAYNVKAFRNIIETTDEWDIEILENDTCAITKVKRETLVGKIVIPGIIKDKRDGNENKAYRVVEIGDGVFERFAGITEVDFSSVVINNFNKIGARAFKDCEKLAITIPDDIPSTITYIGDNAFEGCKLLNGNLDEIHKSLNAYFGKGVFMGCSRISGKIQSVFDENFYLKDGIPNSTEITDGQFSGFSGLTGKLTIPYYITSIGNNAFSGCKKIEELTFENLSGKESRLNRIGDYAFYRCSNIENKLVFPDSVTKLGNYSFAETGIVGVELPANITSENGNLGSYIFNDCNNLTGQVTIPCGIINVPDYMFSNTKITSLFFEKSGEKMVKTIGSYAFYQCRELTKIECSESTQNNKLSFPNGLETIKEHAFQENKKLTEIYFPDTLKVLKYFSFRFCTNLDVKKWSNSLETIEASAFSSSENVRQLPIPECLKSLGSTSFNGCKKLGYNPNSSDNCTNIIDWLNRTQITTVYNLTFSSCEYLKGDLTYLNKNVEGAPFTKTKVTKTAQIADGKEIIETAEFANTSSITNVIDDDSGQKVLTIPSSVKTIKSKAFSGSSAFTKLVIPNTVTSIEESAFEDCSNLEIVEFAVDSPIKKLNNSLFKRCQIKSIILPNNLEEIGNSVFYNNSMFLENNNYTFIVPSKVKKIGDNAFSFSYDLKEIIFNDNINSIGSELIPLTKISKITIPNSVTILNNKCFYRCPSLKEVTIGTGVTKISDALFSMPMDDRDGSSTEFGNLEKVTFNGNITLIGNDAFARQEKLKEINGINWKNITSIGSRAFWKCEALNISGTLNSSCTIGEEAFYESPIQLSR